MPELTKALVILYNQFGLSIFKVTDNRGLDLFNPGVGQKALFSKITIVQISLVNMVKLDSTLCVSPP